MDNIYSKLRLLAKSVKAQNLFVSAKELQGIRLFRNVVDFSKLQELYLSYLYMYDSINRDIIIDKISNKIYESDIYEDAYLLFKKGNKKDEKKDNKNSEIHLIMGNKINFPKSEVK